MTVLPRSVRISMLLRSFAVQGSWNYETLIGTGFAFAVLPALKRIFGDDEEALRSAIARHTSLFNSHPYLATVAIGAVARLEADRVDPKTIERFKSAMRGSLGSIGDQLVWCAWRPASALVGLVLLLAGATWWVSAVGFLAIYNALHVPLRAWGLRVGAESGLQVGRLLREAPLQALSSWASNAGAVLCGFAVVLLIVPLAPAAAQVVPALVAVGLGLWLGSTIRRIMVATVVLSWLVAMLSSWVL